MEDSSPIASIFQFFNFFEDISISLDFPFKEKLSEA